MPNEKIEWTNVWRNSADTDLPRILLIGDSIVHGIQHEVYKLLPEGVAASCITTSKGVDTEYFTKEIALIAEQDGGKYELVYFNNGLHFHSQTPDEYAENYRKRLDELKSVTGCGKWILGLSTPINIFPTDPSLTDTPITLDEALPLDRANETVIEYNERVKEIAKEYGYELFDAYSLMLPHSNLKRDSHHYNEEGRRIMANSVAAKITELL